MKRNAFFSILAVFTMAASARSAEMNIFVEPEKPLYRARKAPVPEAPKPAQDVAEKTPSEKTVNGPIATPQWVQTMEASVNSPMSPHSTAQGASGWGGLAGWTGWILAAIFGGVLFLQNVRDRKTRNMLRAGNRDQFFLPPTRRRL